MSGIESRNTFETHTSEELLLLFFLAYLDSFIFIITHLVFKEAKMNTEKFFTWLILSALPKF